MGAIRRAADRLLRSVPSRAIAWALFVLTIPAVTECGGTLDGHVDASIGLAAPWASLHAEPGFGFLCIALEVPTEVTFLAESAPWAIAILVAAMLTLFLLERLDVARTTVVTLGIVWLAAWAAVLAPLPFFPLAIVGLWPMPLLVAAGAALSELAIRAWRGRDAAARRDPSG